MVTYLLAGVDDRPVCQTERWIRGASRGANGETAVHSETPEQ